MTDLMKEQIKIEERMASLGIERFRENYHNNIQNCRATDSQSVNVTLMAAINPLVEAIDTFRADAKGGRAGRRHSALRAIEGLDSSAVAYIVLKLVLDGIIKDRELTPLAHKIGSYIEIEQRVRLFSIDHPDLARMTVKRLDGQTSHGEHRRKVLAHMLNTGESAAKTWTSRDKIIAGIKLVELLSISTGLIKIEIIKVHRRPLTIVSTTDRFRSWLDTLNLQCELMSPEFFPCVIPPKDWVNLTGGGYHTDALAYPLNLVKTRSKQHIKLLKRADLSLVYKAINAMQRTAWRVNSPVLKVAEHLMKVGSGMAGLPSDNLPLPTKPHDIESNEVARKSWRRAAAKIYEQNTALESRRIQAFKTLATAKQFSNYEKIYFPYQLDFRGRVYSVVSGLSPQSTDMGKALLTFAKGDLINTKAARDWLYIHGANCFGIDKVSFADRVRWVEENSDLILSVVKSPLDFLWWADADSPFCFLAFCYEFAGLVEADRKGLPFYSSLPIAMDGSCNGLQHYSAMLQDPIAGKAVNLVPSETPQDIYQVVANKVNEKLLEKARSGEEDAPMAMAWSQFGIDRKITKRPVMVLPYGGTLNSCQKYVYDAVLEKGNIPFPVEEHTKAANWLASVVWTAIGDVVISAKLAMGWLRQTASLIIKSGGSLSWITPTGFPVFQNYPTMEEVRLTTVLFGKRYRPRILEEKTAQPDKRRQVNGVAPNFIHSLDAAALMLTVCDAVDRGVVSFAMIHDSYGTTAAQSETLAHILRQQFVDMYESYDALEQFLQTAASEKLQPSLGHPPFVGGLELSQVLESKYFFA